MNRTELRYLLDRDGINPEAYSLSGGLPSEKYCIDQRTGGWHVYYSERGNRNDDTQFESEDDACRELLDRVLSDPPTRMRTGPQRR